MQPVDPLGPPERHRSTHGERKKRTAWSGSRTIQKWISANLHDHARRAASPAPRAPGLGDRTVLCAPYGVGLAGSSTEVAFRVLRSANDASVVVVMA